MALPCANVSVPLYGLPLTVKLVQMQLAYSCMPFCAYECGPPLLICNCLPQFLISAQ